MPPCDLLLLKLNKFSFESREEIMQNAMVEMYTMAEKSIPQVFSAMVGLVRKMYRGARSQVRRGFGSYSFHICIIFFPAKGRIFFRQTSYRYLAVIYLKYYRKVKYLEDLIFTICKSVNNSTWSRTQLLDTFLNTYKLVNM
jgi:hypothetical protein